MANEQASEHQWLKTHPTAAPVAQVEVLASVHSILLTRWGAADKFGMGCVPSNIVFFFKYNCLLP